MATLEATHSPPHSLSTHISFHSPTPSQSHSLLPLTPHSPSTHLDPHPLTNPPPLTTLSTHLHVHSHTHPLTNRPLNTFSTHAHPHLPLLFLPPLVLALDLLRGEGVDVGAPRMFATQLWTRPCQTT